MKKRILMALMLVVTLVALSACSPPLTEGVCVDKRHTDGYTTRWMQMIRVGKTNVPIWHTTYHADTWRLQVAGVNADGDEVVEWWNVSQEVYEATDIGDTVKKK